MRSELATEELIAKNTGPSETTIYILSEVFLIPCCHAFAILGNKFQLAERMLPVTRDLKMGRPNAD